MDLLATIGLESTHTPLHIILIRLIIASGLGAIIGWERGRQAGTAGLRTHILIALAAALFTTLSFEIFHEVEEHGGGGLDPIRAVEAVTAGIAFLGAGAIFQQRGNVQGLTTGAGMWLAGAVGVSAAIGYYVIALAAAVLAVLVLVALRRLSHQVVAKDHHKPDESP
ncbi:MAG: MgtC/SapB family protein [Acetobacteraceae bacterium]|nr:MAG: MgtC/SapB family protein [Acetobacteraceae bacterium]